MTGEESNHESDQSGQQTSASSSDKIASVFNEKDKECLAEAEEAFRKRNFQSKRNRQTIYLQTRYYYLFLLLLQKVVLIALTS